MKRVFTYLTAAGLFLFSAGLLLSGCTKEGPQGPPGADGKDGQDANATCTQCHTFSDDIVAKIFQYDASQHATGSTAFENGTSCAPCHTSQGFREILETGEQNTAEAIANAAEINCRTCHKIHETYTTADYALRTVAPITLRINGQTLDLPASDRTSNLCAVCHQPRAHTPWPTPGCVDSMNITTLHWGPHYGTQSTILAGMGAFEGVDGAAAFTNSPHRNLVSCSDCHSASSVGNMAGGHTLWMESEEGDNVAGCTAADCHPDAEDFDVDGKQTEIMEKFIHLEELLVEAGFLDETLHIIPGKYAQDDLCVIWNWFMVEYDRSTGAHNYLYTRDILDNGISHMEAKKGV